MLSSSSQRFKALVGFFGQGCYIYLSSRINITFFVVILFLFFFSQMETQRLNGPEARNSTQAAGVNQEGFQRLNGHEACF